ncbi:MAG: alpha/beta hydrolase [Acidobacteriota bacterium]
MSDETFRLETGAGALAVRLSRPEDADSDRAMLYLHGFGSSQEGEKADLFRRRAVAAGLAFCSFDFRGHGASGGSMEELSLSRNLEDIGRVDAALTERGFGRRVLFGSSMGGASAMWWAARHPGRVEAAIHLAPALELAAGLAAVAGEDGMARWERDGYLRFATELVEVDLGWDLWRDLEAYPVEDLRSLYRTPTLIFQGMQDASVPWRGVMEFVAGCAFQEIRLELFADGDHRLLDRLDRLWELTAGFLADCGLL